MSSKYFGNKNNNTTNKRSDKTTNKGKQTHNKNVGVKKSGRGK